MHNLIGLCVYSKDLLQTSGDIKGFEVFFSLQGEKEMLSQIDVRRDNANNLALIVC